MTISKVAVVIHTDEVNRSTTITTLAMSVMVLGLTRTLRTLIVTYTKCKRIITI